MARFQFTERTGTQNPFNGIDVGDNSAPTLVDIDKDGDLDAFSGEYFGTIKYFKNTGNSSNPKFVEVTGTQNPFNGIDVGDWSTPTLVDIDGDGDLDAFSGERSSSIQYFKNTGNSRNPKFIAVTGTQNPFNGIYVDWSKPTLADIDGDGDLDAFIGEYSGSIYYFKNTGNSSNPKFVEVTGAGNPFNGIDVGDRSAPPGDESAPTLVDIDEDGDLDAFIGGLSGTIYYFKNTGNSSNPKFVEVTGAGNPFNGIDVGYSSTPTLVDINGDGDLDAFIGESDGKIKYFQNVSQPNRAPRFVKFIAVTGTQNPFNGIDVGYGSTPTLVDIDKDGDLDAFIGEKDGTIKYFKNTGNSSNLKFIAVTGTQNPFNGIDVGYNSAPTLVDIDQDGDLDAFIGEYSNVIYYFKNTGNSSNPKFIAVTGTQNPFNGIYVGRYSTPTLVDIDGDGDLDAFSGEKYGTIHYFKNTGNSSNPKFIAVTGTQNPFNGQDVDYYSNPTLVDIDEDGDLDAFSGGYRYAAQYFQNTGTSRNPKFIAVTGTQNPFNEIYVGKYSDPTLVDIDQDGDLDAFIGEFDGSVKYFQNTQTLILTAINEDETSPTGNSIAEIIDESTIYDADDTPDEIVEAVAITAVDNSNGNWQYSTNGGSTWNNLGAVTEAIARLLDSNHKVRFIPNPNWFGTANITLRLWDKSTGVGGGTADTTSNGGETAFSEETRTAEINVNDLEEIKLVKDLRDGSKSSTPANLTNINNIIYFQANNGINGIELWKSDGSAAGTVVVKDIRDGSKSSKPANLTKLNNLLYFQANNGINGIELWKSDGSAAGTVLVKDIYGGSNSSNPANLTKLNNLLYFQANNGINGIELWKSDGSAAGTVLLKDIRSGGNSSTPSNLINVNGTLFFQANNGANGVELWKSDGSAAGTVLVKDILLNGGSSNPANLTDVNGTLFFTANDGINGLELWKSDGSAAGTVLVKDILLNGGSNPANLTDVNGTLFFTANDGINGVELWKSDGSEAGTVLVKDILLNGGSSNPANLTDVNGTLYFTANNGINGIELWKSDGSAAGTVLAIDIFAGSGNSNPANLTDVGGELYFTANNGINGIELWSLV
ncbi:MAG: VCBS repeat-containing protein [Gomphosphaeria aponina SAG 52.96 = DSM 107014]|uniref:VCBS repeat-containing protein n=1 Tax=Gomphosphaeria aponina SAG 52.96 = DSM 107014 TaxID=1521640 RepID=A0A941JS74_9CHRO|nr:VCBS repeat-containing protein [Gomphosphaeria aponina SAG 52.96 = DSM 107014]